MNVKQFLKPDWRKVFIIAIIFIVLIYLSFTPFLGSSPIFTQTLGVIIFLFLAFPIVFLNFLKLGIFAFLFGFILSILFWYLITCLIFWIYDKFRKVKKE